MLTQEWLRAQYEDRLRRIQQLATGQVHPVGAVAVVKDFQLATFAASVVEFASSLAPATAQVWHQNFTRTIFLAGDPANLELRYPATSVATDKSVCLYEPDDLDRYEGLRRTLRPLRGPDGVFSTPGKASCAPKAKGQPAFRVTVAASGIALEEYLVHLNHLLAEAVLTGVLDEQAGLELVNVASIGQIEGDRLSIRIAPERSAPDVLRCFAYLARMS